VIIHRPIFFSRAKLNVNARKESKIVVDKAEHKGRFALSKIDKVKDESVTANHGRASGKIDIAPPAKREDN